MKPPKLFRDRKDAGRALARLLAPYRDAAPVVLGLPRGGVPVAYEVARELDAPLDVCVVRKIGAPIQPELGIGAVSEGDALYVDRDTMRLVGVSDEELADLVATKQTEVAERIQAFRRGAPPVAVQGRTVIVVDDGIATGGTARAALQTLLARGAQRVVLAVPVAASRTLEELAGIADEIVCPHPKDAFRAVGLWYDDFTATTDDEVIELLERARRERARHEQPRRTSERVRVPIERSVEIPIHEGVLEAQLTVPPDAIALVVFAHGSGSSRLSPRNQYVAGELQRHRFATLLLDLLTSEEELVDSNTRQLRFDVALLASRLVVAMGWAEQEPELQALPIALFGASTGAAAALLAAAERPSVVRAVVSRGGRPDLAGTALRDVRAPTLLIVGGRDPQVLEFNREALLLLGGWKKLEIVPGATHLFEEPGTLEHVAQSAARWFALHVDAGALAGSA